MVDAMNMCDPENDVPLVTLHNELLQNSWNSILRKNDSLAMIRNIFKRKMKSKLSHHDLSTFLTSSNNISKIMGTVVLEEVEKISKSLMSSRNIFELRKLRPKRGKDILKDCYIFDDEAETILYRIIEIFDLPKYIGPTNSRNIMEWVLKVLKFEECQQQPVFLYTEAPFARAFRARQVMRNEDPDTKRKCQTSIINNLRVAVCWWLLAAFRQVSIPIEIQNTTSYMWRNRYLKVLKREMKDFKMRYLPKRVNPALCSTTITTNIGPLKFSVISNKLRPIFRQKTADRFKVAMHWKQVNSMLSWCMEKSGICRATIKDSCQVISKFLKRNRDYPQIFGYTADISKCFSLVKHRNLICIIERMLNKRCTIWTICGKGLDAKGRSKLLYLSRDSEADAKLALEDRMKRKGVSNHDVVFNREISSKWLLDELRSTITSYYYKRGKTIWKITKGVPQGHPLSSHLSTMYLHDFEMENWRNFEYDPRIIYCRYEDDYVFMTTEKGLFQKMVEPLFTGNNGHSLKANQEKCKNSEETHELFWCGVKMDLKNVTFLTKKRCSDGNVRRLPIKF